MQGNAPTPDGQVADAVTGNWVDTHAPAFHPPLLCAFQPRRPAHRHMVVADSLLVGVWHWRFSAAENPRWEDLWIACRLCFRSVSDAWRRMHLE